MMVAMGPGTTMASTYPRACPAQTLCEANSSRTSTFRATGHAFMPMQMQLGNYTRGTSSFSPSKDQHLLSLRHKLPSSHSPHVMFRRANTRCCVQSTGQRPDTGRTSPKFGVSCTNVQNSRLACSVAQPQRKGWERLTTACTSVRPEACATVAVDQEGDSHSSTATSGFAVCPDGRSTGDVSKDVQLRVIQSPAEQGSRGALAAGSGSESRPVASEINVSAEERRQTGAATLLDEREVAWVLTRAGQGKVRRKGGRQVAEAGRTVVLAAEVGAEPLMVAKRQQAQGQREQSVKAAWDALVRWSKWSVRKLSNDAADEFVLKDTQKVVVMGGGSFGTAMAVMLARNKAEMDVVLLLRDPATCDAINHAHVNTKYFPKHTLPANVRATTNAAIALEGAQYAIHAVPVQHSTTFLRTIAPLVPPSLPIMSVSKGLDVATLEMMSQVIPRALGNPRQPVVVLSGPTFSIELMDKLPTAIVAASKDAKLARAAQQLLASPYLRVNTSSDVVGVEMAGALKNVLAIAAGIVEGMNLGNNCMASLVAQGCAEIRWLAEKMGAKPATLSGLSGTGDIMLTCFVKLSRNRSVGVRLGSGERLEDILASMNQVAEGVATAGAVIALARKYRVSMPVLTAVARILENELTPKSAVMELMALPQVEEV